MGKKAVALRLWFNRVCGFLLWADFVVVECKAQLLQELVKRPVGTATMRQLRKQKIRNM